MKKIFFIIISLIFLASISKLSAQHDSIELKNFLPLDTFRLDRYALPELEYRSLYLNFDLNSLSNTYSWDFINSQPYFTNFYFNPALQFYNSCFSNNKKKQISGYDNLSISYKYRNTKELITGEKKTYNSLDAEIVTSRSFTFYFKNQLFFELTPYVSYDYSTSNDWNYSNLSANSGFFVGKGRIEDVTDAWHTIRILKDLQRENLLTRVPDGSELLEIAQHLSKTNYKRIFDYRIKRKQIMKDLDNILTEKGLIREKNTDYYNSLVDMLEYGTDTRRFANKKMAIGIKPDIYYYSPDGSNKSICNFGLAVESAYTIYKPINISLDFFFKSVLDFGYSSSEYFISNENLFNYLNLHPSISTGLTKYISTRANASIGVNTFYRYIFGNEVSGIINEFYGMRLSSSLKYYFSPRTNLSFNLNLSYNNESGYYKYSKGFGHELTINLKHQLY